MYSNRLRGAREAKKRIASHQDYRLSGSADCWISEIPTVLLRRHHRRLRDGQVRIVGEDEVEFLKCAFGAVRTTHRATHAFPIHLLSCLLAYSLYKSLIV